MEKEIRPPIHLKMEDEEEENEELAYLKAVERMRFKDKDYHEGNKTLNRVRNFTFAGEEN
jgi:hypothetical protein